MQEKKANPLFALIMAIFWPTSSLLFIGREKVALLCAFLLFVCSFLLVYAPLNFIAVTMFFFLGVFFVLWLYGIIAVLLPKTKHRKERTLAEQLPYITAYFCITFFSILLLLNIPVSFYQVRHTFENVNEGDILIVQEKVPLTMQNFNDSIIFYNENYEERFGMVKAVAGDVLEFKDLTLYRNGQKLANIANFPTSKFIVPENLVLIQHDKDLSPNLSKEEYEKYHNENIKTLSFLTVHRIKGKALFILFSTHFDTIAKRLIFANVKNG